MSNLWYLVYETLHDAQLVAHWLLKGSREAKKVLIVGADMDVPDNFLHSAGFRAHRHNWQPPKMHDG